MELLCSTLLGLSTLVSVLFLWEKIPFWTEKLNSKLEASSSKKCLVEHMIMQLKGSTPWYTLQGALSSEDKILWNKFTDMYSCFEKKDHNEMILLSYERQIKELKEELNKRTNGKKNV